MQSYLDLLNGINQQKVYGFCSLQTIANAEKLGVGANIIEQCKETYMNLDNSSNADHRSLLTQIQAQDPSLSSKFEYFANSAMIHWFDDPTHTQEGRDNYKQELVNSQKFKDVMKKN